MSLVTLASAARFMLEDKEEPVPRPGHAPSTPPNSNGLAARDRRSRRDSQLLGLSLRQRLPFSDDAEPGGTAGRPILAAIDNQGFDRVMVVVTRWYGGINLGAGGLARAYGGSAAECLRTAERRELLATVGRSRVCDFALANSGALAVARVRRPKKPEESFDEHGLRLRLRLPASMFAGLAQRLRDLSRGAATLTIHRGRGRMSTSDGIPRQRLLSLRGLLPFLRPHARMLVCWLAALAFSSSATLFFPVAFKHMIDQGFATRHLGGPLVHPAVRGGRGAGAGDRRPLLFRVPAGRARHRRPARRTCTATCCRSTRASSNAPAAANCCRGCRRMPNCCAAWSARACRSPCAAPSP